MSELFLVVLFVWALLMPFALGFFERRRRAAAATEAHPQWAPTEPGPMVWVNMLGAEVGPPLPNVCCCNQLAANICEHEPGLRPSYCRLGVVKSNTNG